MASTFQISIHPSQRSEVEQQALSSCLGKGWVDPRLHYRTILQSERWLSVFERWAPFVNSQDCKSIYSDSSSSVAEDLAGAVSLIALGCGDGRKDWALLEQLDANGAKIQFVPLDVSSALVERAANRASTLVPVTQIHPLLVDLERSEGLADWLDETLGCDARRIFTFYGMIPNFRPVKILPILRALVRSEEYLLFSANLVKGEGVDDIQSILPQYDNEETRAWLLTMLEENGVQVEPTRLEFLIESDPDFPMIHRIVADYTFEEDAECRLAGEQISFVEGTTLRMFFSYRYSQQQITELLNQYGLQIERSWVTKNSEEGVFLCRAS